MFLHLNMGVMMYDMYDGLNSSNVITAINDTNASNLMINIRECPLIFFVNWEEEPTLAL